MEVEKKAISQEEIERRYLYHAPDDATRALHDEWRRHERWYAEHLADFEPSREISLALTALEELSFWVHAHIARNMHPRGDVG